MKKYNTEQPQLTFWKGRLDETKLGIYVYGIGDPGQGGRLFYIGKGGGKKGDGNNRPDHHLEEAFEARKSGKAGAACCLKALSINKIWDSGGAPTLCVIRRNLTEEGAFDVEAAAIDLMGLFFKDTLVNRQGGHDSERCGIITEADFGSFFAAAVAPRAVIKSVFVFNISNTIKKRSSAYEAVRASWKIRESKCILPAYAVGLVKGISRVVVGIKSWHPGLSSPNKKSFQGVQLDETSEVGKQLFEKDFSRLLKNPKTGKPLGNFQRGGVISVDFLGAGRAIITRGVKDAQIQVLAGC